LMSHALVYTLLFLFFFFFNATSTTEIYTLSLHDALPISKGALTYTDIAGDPVLYGNLPPREISMKDVFRSGDSSKKFHAAASCQIGRAVQQECRDRSRMPSSA